VREKEFYKLVNRRFNKITEGLVSKGKEYSTEDDKLHNFKKASDITGKSKEEALMGFMLKHIVSINDIIEQSKEGKLPSREVIDEKIGDVINYFILLEACLVERIQNA